METTLNIDGYTVEIRPDDWAENPREWASSTLCTAHRRYTFGGESLPEHCQDIEEAFDMFLAERALTRKLVIWLPIYLYKHSGLALSTAPFSDRWDSGHLGFIYETRENIRKEFGVKRINADLEERVCERLRGELEELEHWSNGTVYRLSIPGLDVDSGGFFGFDHEASGFLEYARDVIEYDIRCKRKEHFKRLKRLIRGKVGLQYRPVLSV